MGTVAKDPNISVIMPEKDLADISRAHGTVYETNIGQVAYTKLVDPEGFVLVAKGDQLRFYMFRKLIEPADPVKGTEAKYGVWEHIWGASSIAHDGLPTGEGLIQYRLNKHFKAGMLRVEDPEKFAAEILQDAADVGSHVHAAAEDLLEGKEVLLAGRPQREITAIASLANFINDFNIRNWKTEQIVAHDQEYNGIRVLFGGTTDLVVEIYDEKSSKWETWLIDYKTSKEAYDSHKVQVMGYKAAVEQSYDIKIDRVGILLLGKQTTKGYQLVEVGTERGYKVTFATFLLCYHMLLFVNGGKLPGPSYKTYPKSIKLIKEGEK